MVKIGIVGMPNVGKSTLFQALTQKVVDTSNYPFATIEPNVGVVAVPDPRLNELAQLSQSERIVPAIVEFVDIAGLVKGASEGEGLGNQFLQHIREVDAILEVVRAFEKSDVTHVEGTVHPKRDMEIILTELALKDLDTVTRHIPKVEKEARSANKDAQEKINEEVATFVSIKNKLERGVPAHDMDETERLEAAGINLLTAKPFMYLINGDPKKTDLADFPPNSFVLDIKEELDASNMSAAERQELDIQNGLEMIIKTGYKMLGLISFLTTGEKETRAWTIKKGSTAKQAGAAIHTDFETKFIKASVIFWEDLVRVGSLAKARDLGLLRTEGKEYIVKDGDVMEFKI
ncbi:MAG: redox-regulated ATPase YchF [Candidatus Niyogibacteria bacterium]|nr:redox-regulated ATPase YchF [Candidatus Niyogibacteria bacterium]